MKKNASSSLKNQQFTQKLRRLASTLDNPLISSRQHRVINIVDETKKIREKLDIIMERDLLRNNSAKIQKHQTSTKDYKMSKKYYFSLRKGLKFIPLKKQQVLKQQTIKQSKRAQKRKKVLKTQGIKIQTKRPPSLTQITERSNKSNLRSDNSESTFHEIMAVLSKRSTSELQQFQLPQIIQLHHKIKPDNRPLKMPKMKVKTSHIHRTTICVDINPWEKPDFSEQDEQICNY